MATDAEIAWAAGLFEGEGTVGISMLGRRIKRPWAKLSLTTTDYDVIEKFWAIVGCGNVLPRRRQQAPHHKQAWVWNSGARADVRRVLESFLPWLGERRTAAALNALLILPVPPRTSCNRGHPLVGPDADVYVTPQGCRECRVCRRMYDARRSPRLRAS